MAVLATWPPYVRKEIRGWNRDDRDPLDKVFGRVDITPSCWVWKASPEARYPYPHVMVGRRARVVHRWLYELAYGPVPKCLVLDHLCENTRCVNPDHLQVVTPEENSRRKGTGRTVFPPY